MVIRCYFLFLCQCPALVPVPSPHPIPLVHLQLHPLHYAAFSTTLKVISLLPPPLIVLPRPPSSTFPEYSLSYFDGSPPTPQYIEIAYHHHKWWTIAGCFPNWLLSSWFTDDAWLCMTDWTLSPDWFTDGLALENSPCLTRSAGSTWEWEGAMVINSDPSPHPRWS